MKDMWQVAAGSIVGREHKRLGRNNQDAYRFFLSEDFVIGLVADGCSDSVFSEVGSQIGVSIALDAFQTVIAGNGPPPGLIGTDDSFWREWEICFLDRFRSWLDILGGNRNENILNFGLFTLVGFMITRSAVRIFGCGDGIYALNGSRSEIGPFPGNMPPYLAYQLVDPGLYKISPEECHIQVWDDRPAGEISSLLIGTDGAVDVDRQAGNSIPGLPEPLGGLEQFWQEDRFFANPHLIRRRLFIANREHWSWDPANQGLRKQDGLLRDDTTLVVARSRR